MLEILRFIFSDIWHFLGIALLLHIVMSNLADMVWSWRL